MQLDVRNQMPQLMKKMKRGDVDFKYSDKYYAVNGTIINLSCF